MSKLVAKRRTRSGRRVELLRDGDCALDGLRWETVCVEHGGVVGHTTRRLAEQWLSHPEEWCPTCQEIADEARELLRDIARVQRQEPAP